MFFHRVVEAHGNNWLYLRRYVKNRKAQQWVFNEVDKTLHSHNWKNYAMTIHSNGNSNHMRMLSSITSRWW
jgi:prophage antirepressor-like protein